MSPRFVPNDKANQCLVNVKSARDCLLSHPRLAQLPNGYHVIFMQFGSTYLRPFRGSRAVPSLLHHVSRVIGLRAEEQMIRTDTRRVIATMENGQGRRHRTISQFPRDTRRELWAARSTSDADSPVARRSCSRNPHPARAEVRAMRGDRPVFPDFGPKAILNRAWFHWHSVTLFADQDVAETPSAKRATDSVRHKKGTRLTRCLSIVSLPERLQ